MSFAFPLPFEYYSLTFLREECLEVIGGGLGAQGHGGEVLALAVLNVQLNLGHD